VDGAYLAYSKRNVHPDDFQLGMKWLSKMTEWIPALYKSRSYLAEMARAPLEQYVGSPLRSVSVENCTELFFCHDPRRLIFVVNNPAAALYTSADFEVRRLFERAVRVDESDFADGILVGVVGEREGLEAFAARFCRDLQAGIPVRLEWRTVATGSGSDGKQNTKYFQEAHERLGSRFSAPTTPDELTLRRVNALTDAAVRTIVHEVAEAGFVRSTDLLARRGRRHEEFAAALARIKECELLQAECLLQCRKTSAQLVRIRKPADMLQSTIEDLKCAHCGRPFSDELLSVGFTLTKEGRKLSQGSHWMTISVTEKLIELGVEQERIIWNVEDSGEEVDILAEHVNHLWIFELKDRDFGAGDAYPLNYRRVRYRADEAVVITTGKVDPGARRVFDDIADQAKPHLIEGISNLERLLEEGFNRAASAAVKKTLAIPSTTSGLDLVKWYETVDQKPRLPASAAEKPRKSDAPE
jgi:hypothetical protein